jgi:hypothetical protein
MGQPNPDARVVDSLALESAACKTDLTESAGLLPGIDTCSTFVAIDRACVLTFPLVTINAQRNLNLFYCKYKIYPIPPQDP